MNSTAPHVEDRLLDFAYGELSDLEAGEVQVHLDGCAQCAGALADIQGVRRVMANLPEQSAPDAGLGSLLAYAEQAARRVQAGPPPKPSWWRRMILPVGGLAAVAVAFVVGRTTLEETGTDLEAQVTQAVFAEKAVAADPPAPVPQQVAAREDFAFGESSGAGVREPSRRASNRGDAAKKKKVLAVAPAEPSAGGAKEIVLEDAVASRDELPTRAAPPPAAMAAPRAKVAAAERAEAADSVTELQRLSEQAWQAFRSGDRALEAALLRQAIRFEDRAQLPGLLNRLCDAEYALGNDAAGDAACQRVLREFSGQGAAAVAERKMRSRAPGAAAKPASVPAQAAPAEAPAAAPR